LLSLKIALVATFVVALVGIPLAWGFARWAFRGKSVVEAVITLPLVLPPTVVGYLLLVSFGHSGAIGGWLWKNWRYSLIFTWHGAVLAAAVVALPLLYLPARAAFGTVEREMEDTARLMGANWLAVFWHVSLPLARRGIAGGLLLAFARALGELGATIMVFGAVAGQRTLPISVYTDFVAGEREAAWPAVIVLICISVSLFGIYNLIGRRQQE